MKWFIGLITIVWLCFNYPTFGLILLLLYSLVGIGMADMPERMRTGCTTVVVVLLTILILRSC